MLPVTLKFQTSDYSVTHLRTLVVCSRKMATTEVGAICCACVLFSSRLSVLRGESRPSQQDCRNKVSPHTFRPPVHWHQPVLVPVLADFMSESGVWCWALAAAEATRVSAGQPRWFTASASATGEILRFQNKSNKSHGWTFIWLCCSVRG